MNNGLKSIIFNNTETISEFNFTKHASERMKRRGIDEQMVKVAIKFGNKLVSIRSFHSKKINTISYLIDDKSLINTEFSHLKSVLIGLTVIMSMEGSLVTTYFKKQQSKKDPLNSGRGKRSNRHLRNRRRSKDYKIKKNYNEEEFLNYRS